MEERKRNVDQLSSTCSLLEHNPGVYPDLEWNLGPLGPWDNAQPTKPAVINLSNLTNYQWSMDHRLATTELSHMGQGR